MDPHIERAKGPSSETPHISKEEEKSPLEEKTNHIASQIRDMEPSRDTKPLSAYVWRCGEKTAEDLIYEINQGEIDLHRIIPKARITDFLSRYGERITYFKISSQGFSNEELLEFVRFCPNITHLSLESCKVSDSLLLGLPSLPLKELNLTDNQITHVGITALARSTLLNSIKTLNLDENPSLGKEGAQALTLHALDHLEELYLAGCNIGNEGVRALTFSSTLKPKKLDLSSCQIKPSAVRELIASRILDRVENLYLRANKSIGNTSAQAIAQTKLPHLRFLSMTDTGADTDASKFFTRKGMTLQF